MYIYMHICSASPSSIKMRYLDSLSLTTPEDECSPLEDKPQTHEPSPVSAILAALRDLKGSCKGDRNSDIDL